MKTAVSVEAGARRVFAGALEWPGWCRSARDEDGALETLLAYAPRYKAVAGRQFTAPEDVSALQVVERLRGNATTDFGAPGSEPKADRRPLDAAELKRLVRLLKACWKTFEDAAGAAAGVRLKTGPRGGGRVLDAIRAHVLEADAAYLYMLGGKAPQSKDAASLRKAIAGILSSRVRGETPVLSPRRTSPLWTPRYFVRRSAWHALDHAWEIEDRSA